MNNITPEQKQPVIKTLAIAGLIGVIIFIAWLAVQIVQVLPSAISSIASTANSVYNYNPLQTSQLTLNTNETLVNVNQPFALSWNRPYASGTYAFSYNCSENISLNLSAEGKEFSDLDCNKQYDLGPVDNVTLSVNATKERYTDVSYTIAFYRPNSATPAASQTSTTTIVNANIIVVTETNSTSTSTTTSTSTVEVVEEPAEGSVATTTVATTTNDTATAPVVETEPEVVKPKPEPVKPTTPVASKPVYVPVYTYEIPTSKPYGTPDLVVSYLGIGTLSKSGAFTKTGVIYENTAGAIQFSVHNVGNKTSDSWSYVAKLPGKTTYTSNDEKPLLPNERAVITIPFESIKNSYFETFSVVATTEHDANINTNSFATGAIVLH